MTDSNGTLRYPNWRRELILELEVLADSDHQERYWIQGEMHADGSIDCFDSVVHFLFDDMHLEDYPDAAIGTLLYDRDELRVVSKVLDAINVVFNEVGLEGSDAEYVHSAGWPCVIEAATHALTLLRVR